MGCFEGCRVDMLHVQRDWPWSKQLAHNTLPVVMASVGQQDWMQCGKACVEWIARLSPPTLPLFEVWQKRSVHGQRLYFKGSRIVVGLFPPIGLLSCGTKHSHARLSPCFILFKALFIIRTRPRLWLWWSREFVWIDGSAVDIVSLSHFMVLV